MSIDNETYRALRSVQIQGTRNRNVRESLVIVGKPAIGSDIRALSYEATVDYVSGLQDQIIKKIGAPQTATRAPSLHSINDLIELLGQDQGGVLVMRHGIQEMDKRRLNLQGAAQKIANMQLPFNMTDSAAAQSLAEAASYGLVLKKVAGQFDIPVNVISSPNHRAAEVGAVISAANGFNFTLDDRLKCINYPKMPVSDLDRLLGSQNKGALTWDENIIDSIAGKGAFQSTLADMKTLIAQSRGKRALTVLVTHTPQTNAIDAIVGESPVRMKELGFLGLNTNASLRFASNIFRET